MTNLWRHCHGARLKPPVGCFLIFPKGLSDAKKPDIYCWNSQVWCTQSFQESKAHACSSVSIVPEWLEQWFPLLYGLQLILSMWEPESFARTCWVLIMSSMAGSWKCWWLTPRQCKLLAFFLLQLMVSCAAGEAFPSTRCAVSNSAWQWCPQKGKCPLTSSIYVFHVGKLNTGIVGTWCRECSCNWSQKKKTILAFNPGSEQAFHSLLAVFA